MIFVPWRLAIFAGYMLVKLSYYIQGIHVYFPAIQNNAVIVFDISNIHKKE